MKPLFKVNKLKGNEQGMALLTVLMVLVIVSVLGLSLMGLASTNLKMSSGERNNQSSYYIAESGATYLMNDIIKKVNEAYTAAKSREEFITMAQTKFNENNFYAEKQLTSFENNLGQQPIAKYKLEAIDAANGRYKIVSTGTVNNRTRKVEQEFTLRWSVLFPKTAVFVDNTITVDSGSSIINGSIGTNSIANNAITLHDVNSLQSGSEIIVGPNAPNYGRNVVNINNFTNIKVLDEEISLDLKPFKEKPALSYPTTLGTTTVQTNGDLTITSDTTISNPPSKVVLNNLTIDNGKKLNFDIGTNNTEIYVNNLVLNNNSILNVTGSGILSIYVDGDLTINNAVINQDDAQKDNLIIYLRKSTSPKSVTASASGTGINCSIFAEDASFKLAGGTFSGRFVTGGFLEITGNNVIKGSVIADSLHLWGSSSITFVEEDAILPLPSFKINPMDPEPVREK